MEIREKSLDDLMNNIFGKLINLPCKIETRKGTSSELSGVLLCLTNPRARLSRTETKGKTFSAIGELLWYLSGSNKLDFIKYYLPGYEEFSDDGETIYGGYGPRLIKLHNKYNQIQNVIKLLKENPTSRKAVIQLFDGIDIIKDHKDVPCTCTLQFLVREGKLLMFTTMRSNDIFLGLPHDFFAFTMLQEIVAMALGVQLGEYKHFVGSLHLYKNKREEAEYYLKEGFQSTVEMPKMPQKDLFKNIDELLKIEKNIRVNSNITVINLQDYWYDFARLLLIHSHFIKKNINEINKIKSEFSYFGYKTYVDNRLERFLRKSKNKL